MANNEEFELRDQFAAAALTGIIMSDEHAKIATHNGFAMTGYKSGDRTLAQYIADQAYIIADAMLEARES